MRTPPSWAATVPHVLISALGVLRGLIDEALAADGLRRTVAVSLEHFSTLPYLLKGSPLLANVPRRAARVLESQFGLRAVELPLPSPTFNVAAVWHARSEDDPGQTWLRERLVELLSGVDPQKAAPS